MILFDFSQIAMSTAIDYHTQTKKPLDMGIVRHIILSHILSVKSKLSQYADEIVLCLDSRSYWRTEVFPNYKKHRQKVREESDFDWDDFFIHFNQLKEELKESSPFKVIEIKRAEADDIIAVLSIKYGEDRNIVIVSSDNDFLQLQAIHSNIKQYSLKRKDFINIEESKYSLFEHIIKGDSGDGIPNFLTDDDVFLIEGKRSKPISTVKLNAWKSFGLDNLEEFCCSVDEMKKVKRNQSLIDLTKVPTDIKKDIIDTYEVTQSNRSKTHRYLVKHQLVKILKDNLW